MERGVAITAAVCLAEVLTMLGTFAFPALLPVFFAEWGLTNTEAGWISGIYFAGYTVAVPVLVSLTDRVDARLVWLCGAGLTAAAAAGFAIFAEGFWTAFILRAVAGAGLAGTYMPGLRALVDRYHGPNQPRVVAFYAASFSLGTALSFLFAGLAERAFGWRWAFALAALAVVVAAAVLAAVLEPRTPKAAPGGGRLLDFRPVLRNRRAMGYVMAYGVHAWELMGLRSWLVAFLVFSLSLSGGGAGWLSPTTVATLSALVATAASIGGGEAASRFGRPRTIAVFMVVSALAASAVGFAAALPYGLVVLLVLVYSALVQADSAALTTGALEAAEPGRSGATLAVHSMVGFAGGALGPLVAGVVLDLGGGGRTVLSWGLAFAAIGLLTLLGPPVLAWSRKGH